MSVKFQDYYEILGISREATQKEIQTAYRKLARKYHPDINKSSEAEEKFKQINEANEVLKDPEKRKMYDQLGHNWKNGQEFTPPSGWDRRSNFGGGGSEFHFSGGDFGDFSDFFSSIFGNGGYEGFSNGRSTGRRNRVSKGEDLEAEINITLEEAYHGGNKNIQMQVTERGADGRVSQSLKDYSVKIPKGITDGKKIRLRGQGNPGIGGGPAGDLYLKVHLLTHKNFEIKDSDLITAVHLTPWEAVLGTKVAVNTLDGKIKMNIPAGTQGEQRFRLRGKGMPKGNTSGDLFVVAKIVVPKTVTDEERELLELWAKKSSFNPRNE